MSYVIAAPETLAVATADIAGIGTALSDANLTAVAPTTGALAAGADEVSAADHSVVQCARQGISSPERPRRKRFTPNLFRPWPRVRDRMRAPRRATPRFSTAWSRRRSAW